MKKYWTTLKELEEAELISSAKDLEEVEAQFQTKIGQHLQTLIKEDKSGALAQQFIPSLAEKVILPSELYDPIGDKAHMPVEGVVHRYPDRALLKVTQLCEVYCRFCFRKEMIGRKGETLSHDELREAYEYFKTHQEVREVILTGGDPFILSNRRLKAIMSHLAHIPHLKILRIHSRIPVVNPTRVDSELATYLGQLKKQFKKQVIVVIHANHLSELNEAIRPGLELLQDNRVMLLSQSVLLKGVNDDLKSLTELMYGLIDFGIKPYYLHQMDKSRGTSHFVVEKERAIELIHQLREEISGICIPHLIEEIPGGKGKVALY